jgi:mannuronan 5-epimerase
MCAKYFFDNCVDPHSGTRNLIIRNNTVYENGKHGIICSKNCDNITIEGNKVFDNLSKGIMLDKNITNSTIADNTIFHNTAQIAIHTLSNNNKIDNNIVYGGEIGIEIIDGSSDNFVSNNVIYDTRYGIYLLDSGQQNKFFSNSINNASDCSILIEDTGMSSSDMITNDQIIFQNNNSINLEDMAGPASSSTRTRITENPGCIKIGYL